MMERVLCILAGYVFGCIQSGYFYGKNRKMDIRDYGSHSTGATNVLRVLGLKAGLTVFICDFLKGFLPCLAVRFIFAGKPDIMLLMAMWTAFGVVLGHDFPFWLGFRGGKGISATCGVMFAIDPLTACLCLLLFFIVVKLSKFVSLGSILAMVLLGILLVVNCAIGHYGVGETVRTEFFLLSVLIPGLAIFRHRANIKRIAAGKENRLDLKTRGMKNQQEGKSGGNG
jgi:glycerol-3-phosphate acyltransferase PlsY